MTKNIPDLKTGLVIQFYQEKEMNSDISYYHAKQLPKPRLGMLKDNYFLDIETLELYPIAPIGIENELIEVPIMDIYYVSNITNYQITGDLEQEELIKKAIIAEEWYEYILENENNKKIISFQKRKIQLLKNNNYKRR